MQRRVIGCMGLLILLFLLSGCLSNQKMQENPVKQPIAQTGGEMVYGSLYEPVTLNPLLSDLSSTHEVASLIFSGLVYMDDQGIWQPDLVTEVPEMHNGGVSADGKVVTYRLRNNVQWHDGRPFTAEDVVFTWRLIMNPKHNVITREGYDRIASIEAVNSTTLVIRFRELYPPFLSLFSRILPKHLLEGVDVEKTAFNRSPIGTGPFQFIDWRMGETIRLKSNPLYHLGRPNLDAIVYKVIPDINMMLTQIKAGNVDIIGNLDHSLIEQARAIDDFNVVTNPTMVWEHIDFNLDNSLLQDVRVRQAISLAIDREAIIAEAYRSAAAVAVADQWPVSWAARKDLSPVTRDLGTAKELLKQAGWQQGPDGLFSKERTRLRLSLVTTAGNKQRESAMRLLTQQLRESGIELVPRFAEIPSLFTSILPRRNFDMALYAWYLGPDPDNSGLWHSRNIPGPNNRYQGKNYPGWRNSKVDQLLDQAGSSTDVNSRRQIYYSIQELIRQEVPVIPLYFHSNIGIAKKTVLNYRPNASPAGNLWNAWQWAREAK